MNSYFISCINCTNYVSFKYRNGEPCNFDLLSERRSDKRVLSETLKKKIKLLKKILFKSNKK